MKHNKKSFWTLDRHHAEGFTLVELIVVIAILAILAGVAVPVYSGYITKTNITADQSLVGEMKHALALAYYSNPNGLQGAIVLSGDAAPDCGENTDVEAALAKAFGEEWKNREDLRLKHDGWSATFQGSNFYNDEEGLTDLLGTVDTLTGALEGFLANHSGEFDDGKFGDYMNQMVEEGAGDAAKADAAVFYVADRIGSVDASAMQNIAAKLQDPANLTSADAARAALESELDGSLLTSTATLYALAEGYASYCETNNYTFEGQSPRDYLSSFNDSIKDDAANMDAMAIYTELFNTFGQMGAAGGANNALQNYLQGSLAQDLSAFGEAMKTVSSSKDGILNDSDKNLGDEGFFTSDYVTDLLSAYAEGGVFIYVMEENGQIKVSSSIDAV